MKMERKSILIYTIGGLAVASALGIGIYMIVRKPKAKEVTLTTQSNEESFIAPKSDSTTTTPAEVSVPSNSVQTYNSPLPAGTFPLQIGSRSNLVKDIQKAMNDKFGTSLVVDGILGEETAKAICKKAFMYCDVKSPINYRGMKLQQRHYDDIIAGTQDLDFSTKLPS